MLHRGSFIQMKKYIYLNIIILFAMTAKTQNLVPNPSFEFYTSCPTGSDQVYKAFPWYDPTGV